MSKDILKQDNTGRIRTFQGGAVPVCRFNIHEPLRCAALFWPFMPLFITSLASADVRRDPVAMLLASRPVV